jgi:hypothetical protein
VVVIRNRTLPIPAVPPPDENPEKIKSGNFGLGRVDHKTEYMVL